MARRTPTSCGRWTCSIELKVFPHNPANCSPVGSGYLVFVSTSNGIDEGQQVELHPCNAQVCAEQFERFERIRCQWGNATVKRTFHGVLNDAREGRDVMRGMIDAVRAYATVGELTNCLVEVCGRYNEPVRS